MIFLDTDHDWILARDRQELIDALLERIDVDNDDHLLKLAAACFDSSEEDTIIRGL